MIVGLSGLKGSGKDTAAEYLCVHYGFKQFALGDHIYQQVAKAFNVSEAMLRSREWKDSVQPELALRNCTDQEFVRLIVAAEMPQVDYNISPFCTEAQTCPRTSTFIIQRWATEYRRAVFGKGYWASLLMAELMVLPPYTKVVISDVREDHEVEVLEWFTKSYGPMKCGIMHIVAPGTQHTGHSSDDGLSRQYIDATVYNNKSNFAQLYNQIDQFIESGMKWKPIKSQ